MLKRDFNPGFYVEHFVKDLKICISESEKMGLTLPGLQQATKLYQKLETEMKGNKLGTQALLTVLEEMNQLEVKKYDIWFYW